MKKLLILFSLVLLVACQNDDEMRVPKSATITFGTASNNLGLEWEIGEGISRGDDDIDSDLPEDMGVFAYYNKKTDQEVFNNQHVFYFYSNEYTANHFYWEYWNASTGQGLSAWPYTITPGSSEQKKWERRNYRMLAYAPWTQYGVSVSTADYNFNTFRRDGIPEYSDCDYLIAKQIVAVDNTHGTWKTTDLVTFEMQHLMARIRFIFKMSKEYREIRRIVINSVSVQSSGKQNSATITYKADNSLNAITWGTLTDGAAPMVNLVKESDKDYNVKTDFAKASSFGSLYILPQSEFKGLTITVKYSTFDSAGIKTRDAEITNSIMLSDPRHLIAGRYYDLKISIVPDYLYVLSDNDQDFDGWMIVNDHN